MIGVYWELVYALSIFLKLVLKSFQQPWALNLTKLLKKKARSSNIFTLHELNLKLAIGSIGQCVSGKLL